MRLEVPQTLSRTIRYLFVLYVGASLIYTAKYFVSVQGNGASGLSDISARSAGNGLSLELQGGSAEQHRLAWSSSEGRKYPMTEAFMLSKLFDDAMGPSHVIPYYFKAEQQPEQEDITIATLITYNRFAVLSRLATRYKGPISVALHVNDDDDRGLIISDLHALINENPDMQKYVDIHLIVDNFDRQFNMWRNVAKFFARSDYLVMLDVDFHLCTDFRTRIRNDPQLMSMLRQGTNALVIPAFEFSKLEDGLDWQTFPTDKSQLLSLVQEQKIDMFHKSWQPGHGSTNYTKWYGAHTDQDYYEVTEYNFSYEPYIVYKKEGTPWCDERFIGYGANKAACLFEIYLSGVDYWVLPSDFLIHQTHHYPEDTRAKERRYNRKLYNAFREELCLRYSRMFIATGAWDTTKADNAACMICGDGKSVKNNQIVLCDGLDCDIPVHQNCYGIGSIPKGKWYCQRCADGVGKKQMKLACCEMRSSAVKRTSSPGLYMHVVCQFFDPGVTEEDGVYKFDASRLRQQECYLCRKTTGLCVTCQHDKDTSSKCARTFHVACAVQRYMDLTRSMSEKDTRIYCKEHYNSNSRSTSPAPQVPRKRHVQQLLSDEDDDEDYDEDKDADGSDQSDEDEDAEGDDDDSHYENGDDYEHSLESDHHSKRKLAPKKRRTSRSQSASKASSTRSDEVDEDDDDHDMDEDGGNKVPKDRSPSTANRKSSHGDPATKPPEKSVTSKPSEGTQKKPSRNSLTPGLPSQGLGLSSGKSPLSSLGLSSKAPPPSLSMGANKSFKTESAPGTNPLPNIFGDRKVTPSIPAGAGPKRNNSSTTTTNIFSKSDTLIPQRSSTPKLDNAPGTPSNYFNHVEPPNGNDTERKLSELTDIIQTWMRNLEPTLQRVVELNLANSGNNATTIPSTTINSSTVNAAHVTPAANVDLLNQIVHLQGEILRINTSKERVERELESLREEQRRTISMIENMRQEHTKVSGSLKTMKSNFATIFENLNILLPECGRFTVSKSEEYIKELAAMIRRTKIDTERRDRVVERVLADIDDMEKTPKPAPVTSVNASPIVQHTSTTSTPPPGEPHPNASEWRKTVMGI